MRKSLACVVAALVLAGCGGGGSSNTRPDDMVEAPPTPTPEPTTLDGGWQWRPNALGGYDPMDDLPDDGAFGLTVERPQGMRATIRVEYHDEAEGRWDTETRRTIESGLRYGFKQWGRHLIDNPKKTFVVNIGNARFRENCSPRDGVLACAIGYRHELASGMWYPTEIVDWFVENWYSGDPERAQWAAWVVTALMTHEAGHNVGYNQPGGPDVGFHGPVGSGSVMSYDWTSALVTSEDVRHLGPQAQWRGQPKERFTVTKGATPDSVESYGVWIERDMKLEEVVYGPLDGRLGGNDIITVGPFVTGIPSTTARPTGNATWSGDFVGFDIDPSVMALLRADASLRYTLATERMAVGITDFENYYAGSWGTSPLENQHYDLQCAAGGCSLDTLSSCTDGGCTEGELVQLQWHSHEGDATGAAAGTINDIDDFFVGAFAAEKD